MSKNEWLLSLNEGLYSTINTLSKSYFTYNWRNTFTMHVPSWVLTANQVTIHYKCSHVIHLNQCKHRPVWLCIVAPSQRSRGGCERFNMQQKWVAIVSLRYTTGFVFPQIKFQKTEVHALFGSTSKTVWHELFCFGAGNSLLKCVQALCTHPVYIAHSVPLRIPPLRMNRKCGHLDMTQFRKFSDPPTNMWAAIWDVESGIVSLWFVFVYCNTWLKDTNNRYN